MSQSMAEGEQPKGESSSALPVLADICAEEERWVDINPPTEEQERAEPNIIGNWVDEEGLAGEEGRMYPIKVGFPMETRENTDEQFHKVYRTSRYNVHMRIKAVGEGLAKGQVFVRKADGYTKEETED